LGKQATGGTSLFPVLYIKLYFVEDLMNYPVKMLNPKKMFGILLDELARN
jgi:hypothetical protein